MRLTDEKLLELIERISLNIRDKIVFDCTDVTTETEDFNTLTMCVFTHIANHGIEILSLLKNISLLQSKKIFVGALK